MHLEEHGTLLHDAAASLHNITTTAREMAYKTATLFNKRNTVMGEGYVDPGSSMCLLLGPSSMEPLLLLSQAHRR